MNNTMQRHGSIWGRDNLALTVGTIIAITGIAFQGLAVSTIAPVMTRDLHGEHLYGWVFNAFLIPQIIATVFAGREVDRRPPWHVFYPAMALLTLGLVVSGVAHSMTILLLGRMLTGLGAGAMFSTIYAMISGVYDDRLRPQMLAAISSAWIIPSLIGPFVAGFVADHLDWRWVFLLLLPIMALAVPLTWPTYRHIRLDSDPNAEGGAKRVGASVALGFATLLFLAGPDLRHILSLDGTAATIATGIVTTVGLLIIVPMLGSLMPAGTFSLRPMLGAAIAMRGLAMGGFAVAETYLVYSLKNVSGLTSSQAGLVLTVGSLTWSLGSIVQARQDGMRGATSRPDRLVVGTSLMVTAATIIFAMPAIVDDVWWLVAAIAFLMNGFGMGLVHATSTSVAFAHAPRGQDGMVSSSALLLDLFGMSIGVGIGGFALNFALGHHWSTAHASALALSLSVVMLATALVAAIRIRRAAG